MSRGINKVILVGNLGSDPDLRATRQGTAVANCSLATNRKYKDEERTDWHRLVFWDTHAENVDRYARKGSRLYVEGRIEYGTFERDGVTIPTTEIVVAYFLILDGFKDDRQEDGREGFPAAPAGGEGEYSQFA